MNKPSLSKTGSAIVPLSILAVSITVGTPLAQGSVIFSSLDSTPTGVETVRGNVQVAYRFQTGTVGTSARSVRLDIDQDYQISQWTDATIRLYDDSGASGGPGNMLAAFPVYSFSSTDDTALFGDAGSLFELTANTSYWLAIMPTGANVQYHYTDSPLYSGISDYGFHTTANRAGGNGTSWGTPSTSDRTPVLAVETTAVPEPRTVVMFMAGLFAVLLKRNRRQ